MWKPLLFSLGLVAGVGCAPKAAPVESAAAVVPLPAGSLEAAIDALIVKTTDVDRRDRLSAMQALRTRANQWPESARSDLVRTLWRLVEIERQGMVETLDDLTRIDGAEPSGEALSPSELLDMGTAEEALDPDEAGSADDTKED
jgi:hypothetical protein